MLDPHQRHAEPEGAAAIDPAVHADLAAERAHQLAADGEAQPGAAEAPRNRGVGLHEGVEEVGLAALGDADAAVDHREAQPFRAFVAGQTLGINTHLNAALLGELDGVADQVEQDLTQLPKVTTQLPANGRVDRRHEIQPLGLRGRNGERQDVADQGIDVEIDGFDFEHAGLDLRVVEDVGDQRREDFAGGRDEVDVGRLARVERGVAQERRRADDAVDRRADLVAHRGEEGRFGAVGLFGLVKRVLVVADVVEDEHSAGKLFADVEHRLRLDLETAWPERRFQHVLAIVIDEFR